MPSPKIDRRKVGRQKGTPNKATALLKDAILRAAALSGYDKKGKAGLIGYCRRLADEEPKAFCGLLGKVLPTQLTGDNGEKLTVIIERADADLL